MLLFSGIFKTRSTYNLKTENKNTLKNKYNFLFFHKLNLCKNKYSILIILLYAKFPRQSDTISGKESCRTKKMS